MRDGENPDGDIEIDYTGLRPAEKLFEELLIGENVTGTEHPMILRAIEHALPWDGCRSLLDEIRSRCASSTAAPAHEILQRADCPISRPTSDLQDLVWSRRAELGRPAAAEAKVTDLQGPPCGRGSRRRPLGVNEA